MSVKTDLIAARALIDTPERWTKGHNSNPDCLCAMYAVAHVTMQPTGGGRWSACEAALIKALPSRTRGHAGHSVVAFNDASKTTHADIMALFERAIEASE